MKESEVTMVRRHWLSLIAPQHPKKPITMMTLPMEIIIMPAYCRKSSELFSASVVKFLSTIVQIPTPTRAQPTSCKQNEATCSSS